MEGISTIAMANNGMEKFAMVLKELSHEEK
jgi:hypothetical protein